MRLKPLLARALANPVVHQIVRIGGPLLLPRQTLHRLPVSAKVAHYRLVSGDTVTLLDPLRDQIAKDLVWGGGHLTCAADARVLRLVEKWAPEASTFLDIGAYSGVFAMVAAKANSRLRVTTSHAAEPRDDDKDRNLLIETKQLGLWGLRVSEQHARRMIQCLQALFDDPPASRTH